MRAKGGMCLFIALMILDGCSRNPVEAPAETVVTEAEVLSDFASCVVNPNYADIEMKAAALHQSVLTLISVPSEANLALAQNRWREVRQAWEQCEGFLFGPVEDFNYDPTMDDWPVNRVDLDSLLASGNALSPGDVELLPTSLKGFHPAEYLIFGNGGTRTAAGLSDREKMYLQSLTQHLAATTTALRVSWDPTLLGNFTREFVSAGNGSARFAARRDAFIALVTAMAGICEEVADGKMADPLLAQDSTLEESQFSHNSTSDFRNNMTGVLNAYLGKYHADGRGLNDLVRQSNASLDAKIQGQIASAIASFDAIGEHYGKAIYERQTQIHAAQNAIRALKETLEGDLLEFIKSTVKD